MRAYLAPRVHVLIRFLYGALELEAALGRELLPIWPLGQEEVAREGSLCDQLRGIATSPGVRRKL